MSDELDDLRFRRIPDARIAGGVLYWPAKGKRRYVAKPNFTTVGEGMERPALGFAHVRDACWD